MTPPVSIDEVRARLADLKAGPGGRELEPVIQRVETMASTGATDAEPLAAVTEALEAMSDQIAKGAPVKDVLQQAGTSDATYVQPHWSPNTVNQARSIVQFIVVQAASEALPEREPDLLVPIVLLALTRTQAEELATGEALRGQPRSSKRALEQLLGLLEDDWVDRYHDRPEDWEPFAAGGPTIESLITEALDNLSEHDRLEPPVKPEFVDLQSVVRDRPRLWTLRKEGCIVVLDSISLRHPSLQRLLHDSLLDAYPRTSVITLAPSSDELDTARDLVFALNVRLDELEFERRRNNDYLEPEAGCIRTTEDVEMRKGLIIGVRLLPVLDHAKKGIHAQMRVGR